MNENRRLLFHTWRAHSIRSFSQSAAAAAAATFYYYYYRSICVSLLFKCLMEM